MASYLMVIIGLTWTLVESENVDPKFAAIDAVLEQQALKGPRQDSSNVVDLGGVFTKQSASLFNWEESSGHIRTLKQEKKEIKSSPQLNKPSGNAHDDDEDEPVQDIDEAVKAKKLIPLVPVYAPKVSPPQNFDWRPNPGPIRPPESSIVATHGIIYPKPKEIRIQY